MRIVMQIEYDGTHFHGWQSQPGLRTVQGEIEKALSELAQHPVKTICAGRTDTGVHAREQIIHFDTDTIRSEHTWLRGVNHFLPPDISVHNVFFVSEDFHARYSATSRSYEYWIFNSPTPSALKRYSMLWYPQALDEFLMNKAAQHLLGKHNFNAYRAVGCQAKSPIRSISEISVTREENHVILKVSANAFLHHMVRNIVGVLLPIGIGKYPVDWSLDVLHSEQRTSGGMTAPPQGLYLTRVVYPEQFNF